MSLVRTVPNAEQAPAHLTASAFVDPAAIRAGDPAETSLEHVRSRDGRFEVGVWTAQPYAEQVDRHDGYEYSLLLEGTVTLTDTDGTTRTYRAGDAFTVEPGWAGEYRVDEPVIKQFVFYDPRED